jgi:hypothetical protein
VRRVQRTITTATVLCCGIFAVSDVVPRAAQNPLQPPAPSKAQWREDLRYFAGELPKRHKNLYHATSREQFERAVAELDAAIPSLQDHQIIVRLHQIAATVGDGHTGVHLAPYFKRYPVALYWFGTELRVIAAAKEYEKALGARVTRIGTLPIDEVEARIRTCFPSAENENEWYVLSTSPAFIVVPEVLHALGIINSPGPAPFTLEDDDRKQFTVEISPTALATNPQGQATIQMQPAAKQQPLYRQRPAEALWYTYLPDSSTVYFCFRRYPKCHPLLGSCQEFDDLLKFVDENKASRLVIDIRQNGGGDFTKVRRGLIPGIKKRSAIDKKGHLFVIIGRRTFSAAMANATDFRKETNAILVGEPIGERPNSYSENDEMTLPNSRLVVSYSTRYYKFLDEDVAAVMPDKRIEPTWADFKAGRDPVMEWILSSSSAK